jgi:hypothetical protein
MWRQDDAEQKINEQLLWNSSHGCVYYIEMNNMFVFAMENVAHLSSEQSTSSTHMQKLCVAYIELFSQEGVQ